MSVIFTMDRDARVLKHKICRTVIRSDARLNYDEAQAIIMANQTGETQARDYRTGINTGASADLIQAICTLNDMASKLRAERIANGALTIEQDEMRFHLDEHHHPIDIYFESPNESHHLIEEFMLLANRTVAREAGSGRPFVYRVHDIPDQEKLENLKVFKRKMGPRVTQQLQDQIKQLDDLKDSLDRDKTELQTKLEAVTRTREQLEEMCEHCSACEQEAAQAERESIKMFQAMWMADHIGETMDGHISGVTDFGLFVQLDESRCEGLVHVASLGQNGEYWQFDEKNYRLVCEGHKSFTLGDPVKVKVLRADVNKSQIDFELV